MQENKNPENQHRGKIGRLPYTNAGHLKTRTWERGIVTTYNYDTAGRLTTTTYTSDPTNTPNVAYTYDRLSRPLTVTQSKNGTGTSPALSTCTCTYSYDITKLILDTETTTIDTNADGTADLTRQLDRTQDNLLRPTGWELKNGATEHSTTYGYHATEGRLANVSSPADTFTYTYEPASYSLVKSVSRTGGHTVANAYEANRNILLNKNNHTGNPASPVSKYDYALTGTPTAGANSLGQRKNLTTTGSAFTTAPAYTWSYNAAGELTQADDTSTASNDRAYQYDGIGNRQKTVNGLASTLGAAPVNYIANAQNQYTTANGIVLPTAPAPAPYDEDGNMTAGPLPASDTGTNATLLWDAENRLASVTVTANSVTGTTNYSYDAQSRRTVKQPVGGTATHYIYDSWNIIAEYTGITLNKSYTWGMDLSGSMQGAGGVGGLLALKEGTTTYYPTYDGNGNISEYLDSSNAVQAHYEYDAFGNTIVATGTKKDDFAHRFSTKPLDAETGLYYYGYRYYDPVTGRWPSRDPIQERGGINLYGFVGNDGVNMCDKLGLKVVAFSIKYITSIYAVKGSGNPGAAAGGGAGRGDTLKIHIALKFKHCIIPEGETQYAEWKVALTIISNEEATGPVDVSLSGKGFEDIRVQTEHTGEGYLTTDSASLGTKGVGILRPDVINERYKGMLLDVKIHITGKMGEFTDTTEHDFRIRYGDESYSYRRPRRGAKR